jgi:cation diffusion facilitator family transporter
MVKDNNQIGIKTATFSIIANFTLAILKAITGVLGHSFALVADAIESATDALSSTLVLIGLKYAAKPADENHPYGHGKIEPLTTFFVVGCLLASATIIVIQSIHNIRTPHSTPEYFTFFVLMGIILIKELLYRYVNKKGKELNSTALQADAYHHRSDAITSVVALVGIGAAFLLGEGYENLDDWAALFAAALIVYNAYHIFRPALGEIMEEHLYPDLIREIRLLASDSPGVLDTEKCFVRKSGMYFYVDLHIIVDGNITVKKGHAVAHELKDKIQHHFPQIADILIHVEPHN